VGKRSLITVFIASLCFYGVAVHALPKADSLLTALKRAKPDTNKVNLLNELSSVYFQQDPELSRQYGEQVLKLATELKYDMGMLRGNNLVGRCYAVQNNLPLALKHFQAALLIARKMNNPKYEGMLLSSISAVYSSNKDYDKALRHALEARKVNEHAGIKYMVNLMINIGYLYIVQDKYNEALPYYEEGLRQEQAYGSEETIGELANLYLNLGGVYIRMGDYVATLENYFKAADILQRIGHTHHHTFAMADIGETYVRIAAGMSHKPLPDSLRDNNANLDKARYFLEKALVGGEQLGLMDIRSEVYSSLSELYALRKQYQKAYEYKNLHITLRDSLRNIDKEKEFAKIEAEFLVRKQTDSLHYLNALKDKEIHEKKLQRNGGILLISFAGIISLLLINRQKLKHIQIRKMAEADKQRVEELAKLQLADFTKNIQQKNELIEKFSRELENYKLSPNTNEQAEQERLLSLLQSSVILNDEQWINFQVLFNKVYAGYINRVKEKFPDLTTAEIRYILLAKLGLSNKEMAAMLGVSIDAVRVSKHRVLKKIQLPDDISLEEAVLSI
jgi:tetratricopeptide (TPR) repeat protein